MTQPFFSSRKWIKVWINEWRDGTLRWQATDFQRAFWIDLLALAGRSRYPGIVCAGKDGDKVVGYSASFLSPNSGINAENVEPTLELFRSKDMVTYEVSNSAMGDKLYAITITNWKKYQSDYEANKKYQQTYRSKKKASSLSAPCLTSQLGERKNLDLELDLEKEVEEEKTAKQSPFVPTELQIEKWSNFFCGLNVSNEIAKAQGWLDANPEKAVKKRNMKRFYFNWLSKAHSQLLEAEVKGRAIVMQKDELAHREARQGAGQHFEGTIKPESLERLRARRAQR